MTQADILNTVAQLLANAAVPITRVDRYDRGRQPKGITVTYRDGAKVFLWADHVRPDETPRVPADWPEEWPDYRFRALYALRLITDLLDEDPPHGWRWQPVTVAGVHQTPSAMQIHTADATALIRATSTQHHRLAESDTTDDYLKQRHEHDRE